jgi:integrase
VNTPLFEEYLLEKVRKSTAAGYSKTIKRLSNLADIDNTQKITTLICTSSVSEGRKQLLCNAYEHYCNYKGLSWSKPRFVREDKVFFLPLESELVSLISNSRLKMSVFLQLLKESGVDSGEAYKLKWIDLDVERKTIAVTPTKNHNARVLPVSANLLSRLFMLRRKTEFVFAWTNLDDFRRRYEEMRNKLAIRLSNPRIHEIAFKSFRHWKATMLYHQTKDILFVQRWLGHKRIENTLVYTHLVNFESNDFVCKAASNVEEAKALIEAGFDFVTEMDGVKLFRKLK